MLTDGQRIALGSLIFMFLFTFLWIFFIHNRHTGHNCKFIIHDSHNVDYCAREYEPAGPNCIEFYDLKEQRKTVICGSYTINTKRFY